jgi:hypothetical protein
MFNVAQDIGHALGGLLAGAPALLGPWLHLDESGALRAALFACAALLALPIPLYLMLSAAVEHDRAPRLVVSPESRPLLARISALFLLDALGGGFLTTAGLTLIFAQRFGVGAAVLGPLFFAARILNALSHLGAAWLARRIGLVNTMVFTHLPSSLLLVTVAVVPSFPVAAALFLLREGLVEMDVPTRQSYVMAVVLRGRDQPGAHRGLGGGTGAGGHAHAERLRHGAAGGGRHDEDRVRPAALHRVPPRATARGAPRRAMSVTGGRAFNG